MGKLYIGEETKNALRNFPIADKSVEFEYIICLGKVKLACLKANYKIKKIPLKKYEAIKFVIEQLISGKYKDQFVVNSIQGGAGTSINMNFNEVVSAIVLDKFFLKISALDDVNLSQSTNDVLPTALRLYSLTLLDKYISILEILKNVFLQKSNEFKNIKKVARTHLQDAVSISLGNEFKAYSSFISRDQKRLKLTKNSLLSTNLGGTAVGTMVNSSLKYVILANKYLSEITGYNFKKAVDLVDLTSNTDNYLEAISALSISMCTLSKISNDLRLMASGPNAGFSEIILPKYQRGSTIMPGKVNPVILESVNQVFQKVFGSLNSMFLASHEGQLELNVMFPTFLSEISESFNISINVIKKLIECVSDIKANTENIKLTYKKSILNGPDILKKYGYKKAEKILNHK